MRVSQVYTRDGPARGRPDEDARGRRLAERTTGTATASGAAVLGPGCVERASVAPSLDGPSVPTSVKSEPGPVRRVVLGRPMASRGSASEREGEVTGELAAQPGRRDDSPVSDVSHGLGPRQPAPFGDQTYRPDRNPRREVDRDSVHLVVRVDRPAGVGTPGAVPVEGDALTASRDRGLEQLSRQVSVVVMQSVQQARVVGRPPVPAPEPGVSGSSRSWYGPRAAQASMSLWCALIRSLPLGRKVRDAHVGQRRGTSGRRVGTATQCLRTEVHRSQSVGAHDGAAPLVFQQGTAGWSGHSRGRPARARPLAVGGRGDDGRRTGRTG